MRQPIKPHAYFILPILSLFFMLFSTGCPRGGSKVPAADREKLSACVPLEVDLEGNYVVGPQAINTKTVKRKAKIGKGKFEVSTDAADVGSEDNMSDLTSVDIGNWKGNLEAIAADNSDGKTGCYKVEYKSRGFGPTNNCIFTASATICVGPPCTVSGGTWQVKCGSFKNGGGTFTLKESETEPESE